MLQKNGHTVILPSCFIYWLDGLGRYEFESGAVYDGEWLHGTRHGIGKQVDVGGWSAGDLSGRLGFESYRHV